MKKHLQTHTFILAGNGPYLNRGCEAIVRGTTALLREQFGECRFISNYFPWARCMDTQQETDPDVIHSPFPPLSPKRYSLLWFEGQIGRRLLPQQYLAVRMSRISRIFCQSSQDAEAVLMLGGDNYGLGYRGSRPYIFFELNSLAMQHKLPVVIWGASIGPFSSDPDFEQWAAKELNKVALICARETETQQYLASIGVEKNVMLTADPAFYLQPTACELPASIKDVLAKGCIGLNLSPLLHLFIKRDGVFSVGQKSILVWTQIAVEVIRSLLRRFSRPVLLIPHVTSGVRDVTHADHLFLSKVAQLVQEPEQVFVLGPNLNAAQTKWVISRVRVFAGARTHSTLAAISSGVPTICIGYSMKAKGIAHDVYGHLEWLVDKEELIKNPSVLCNRLGDLCGQESEVRSHLGRMNPVFRQRAREAVERLVGIIG